MPRKHVRIPPTLPRTAPAPPPKPPASEPPPPKPPTAPPAKPPAKQTTRARPSALLDTRVIYCGDNLEQLAKLPADCIDLIYIDPPFNSNRNYEVFWGETKEKRAFEDRHASTQAYIDYMRPRCEQLARVLKPTGSFYYHCDWHASHYVKVMLDQIYGEAYFRNEIVWCYTGPGSPGQRQFSRKHDVIFWYSHGPTWTFNADDVRIPHSEKTQANYKAGLVGSGFVGADHVIHEKGKVPEDWWQMAIAPRSKEYLGYPTQKPLPLLERIIKASSNPNDIILDAFCGCGTALVAAQNLNRQWIGIDISPTACRVMAKRLKDVCKMRESEPGHRAHDVNSFIERDLPWTIAQLKEIPPFEFENWAVIALGGTPNIVQVGDMGIDGRIFPVGTKPHDATTKQGQTASMFAGDWFPIQVKQADRVGRPDIDQFEAVMHREDRQRGYFVAFGYTSDAEAECAAFHKKSGRIIKLITVQEILDERHVQKM